LEPAKNEFLTIIKLRTAVGFLGESHQASWWAGSFFSAAAGAFLAPVFGKTLFAAQYNGLREAAAKVHDEHIGVGNNVFHLFRLPETVEKECHSLLSVPETAAAALDAIKNKDSALGFLDDISAGKEPAGEVGPVLIGKTFEIKKTAALKTLAGHYLKAFKTGEKVYPYFSEAK
jgi:hypothetical protein